MIPWFVPEQNGNSFATLSMPARSAVPHHGEALPRQASASYPDRDRGHRGDRDSLAPLQQQAPGTDRLSPLMSAPPGFSSDVRRRLNLGLGSMLTLILALTATLNLLMRVDDVRRSVYRSVTRLASIACPLVSG